ncbi:uncharacterized protein BJ212DRAFT_1302063 [Suillus subaureus]|uniref:DUF6534 domain-containing protein n=1 Tax=Suillus subaureus TaxID=48587 RepID=A0A9P7E4N8_9AGAM|nr:uncharacterized protein BJ212DRAFT_1302063 [Suillus subaureus]KAG1811162.1 hypothetical protein BJ212DRAFT_1302063 [Suillus subaureus]
MSSPMQVLIPQLHLGNTFGALFIGVILAAILFGLSSIQAFFYFQTHRGTGISFPKLAVAWLWILDALHLFLIVHCIYYYLVAHYADISALTELVWSFKLQIVINVIIVYTVHLYVLPYRANGFLRLMQCISRQGPIKSPPYSRGRNHNFGFSRLIIVIQRQSLCGPYLVKIEWSTYMALGAITFVDFIIASSLCYLLATSRTGFSSVCSMTVMITCAVMPHNFIFLSVEFLVAKLYVNSFFALLNARYYLQPTTEINHSSDVHMRHGIYRPELNVMASQDEEFQGSRKNMFKHPGDDLVAASLAMEEY